MTSKRQTIIDTAARLFYANGYHAVGIDRIIAEAGIAKMTLYKHFASKDELIGAVLEERDAFFQESLLASTRSLDDPIKKLEAIFIWHDRWLKEPTFNGCMFISAAAEYPDPDDEINKISRSHKQKIHDHFTRILREITDEKSAQKLSAWLFQILEGAIVTGFIFGDRDAAITAWQAALAVLKSEHIISEDVPAASPPQT